MEVKVKKLGKDDVSESCLLPADIFNQLKLSTEELYNIHFGRRKRACYIKPNKANKKQMYFPKKIFNKLMLIRGGTFNIWVEDKEVYLGPVVGVFVNTYLLGRINSEEPPFSIMQHLKASIEEHCLCYYFSINDIDWETKKIRGVTLDPVTNSLQIRLFPIPNIIYDRGVYFEEEEKPIVKQIRRKFRRNPNIQFINAINTLGKWEVCNQLSKYPEVRRYIPETIVYTSFKDLLDMLRRHRYVFVKSFYGTQGREVLSIEEVNKQYKLNFYDDEVKEIVSSDIKEVEKIIEKFTEGKDFIVQQGIRVLKYEGHNADLYILLEKDGNGEWKAMYNQSTIAKGKLSITNPDAGGDYTVYEQIYPKLESPFHNVKIPDGKTIDEITIKLAKYIEKEFGSFGEMGMDMAIDVYGNVWIIEANSRPDKDLNPRDIDVNGKMWIQLQLEFYGKDGKALEEDFNPLEQVLPQALSIFRYAKYLMKVNETN